MRQKILFLVLIFFSKYTFCQQNNPLINSGDVLKEAVELHDNGEYIKAIDRYLTIDRSDTNYIGMLSELGYSCIMAKRYDSAIKYLKEALMEPSEYKANIYVNLATAWDQKGFPDSAITISKQALTLYPYHYLIWYNMGVAYLNAKKYPEALDAFQKDILNNPYHFSGHAAIGKIMARQGQYMHAMMSIETALILEPGSNRANGLLTYLNNFVNNALPEDEEKIKPFVDNKDFAETDELLKAGIAMNAKYKCPVKFNAPVVKQTQLLFEKFKMKSNSDDFWMKYYGPIFEEVKKKEYTENFIYKLLTTVPDKTVKKQVQKRDADIQEMNKIIGDQMRSVFLVKYIKESDGETKYKSYLDNKTNMLLSIGNYDESKQARIGKWRFYHNNGEFDTEGSYDGEGKRHGKWISYSREGNKTLEITYSHGVESGEYKTFHSNGNLSASANIIDGSVEGNVKYYFKCGALKSEVNFVKGKKNGPGKQYYKNGQVAEAYNFSNDSLSGSYIYYYPDGKKKSEYKYHNDELTGKAFTYYRNGKTEAEMNYKNSKLDGPYKSWFESGNIYISTTYKNGDINSTYIKYFDDGKTTQMKQEVNNKGELSGESREFNLDGSLYCLKIYDNGKLKESTFYNEKGGVISKTKIGSAPVKGYYPNGKLLSEGKYLKGGNDGLWTFYSWGGQKKSTYTYENNELNGFFKTFYHNGALKAEGSYKDGKLDGYYISYHTTGKKESEGWYVNGNKEAKWFNYYPDGKIDDIEYYYEGDLHGYYQHYSFEGTLMKDSKYTYDNIVKLEAFDKDGKTYFKKVFNGKDDFMDKFPGGAVRKKATYECFSLSNKFTYYYKNGTIDNEYAYLNNVKDGPFVTYYRNGKKYSEGTYENDQLTGMYKYYSREGALLQAGKYVNGEKDSIWTYYHLNGKLKEQEPHVSGDVFGMCKNYDVNGEFLYQIYYNGTNCEYYQYLDKEGKLTDPIYFKDSCEMTIYYKDGKMAAQHSMRNNIFCGKQITYYPNGKVQNEYYMSYYSNKLTGIDKIYYENGDLKSEENYLEGDLNGPVKYYREDGTIDSSGEYRFGYLTGDYNYYDKNGKIIKTEKFWNGLDL